MTQAHDPHAGESMVGHDHDGAALGPLDVRTWAMAVLGILLGLLVAIAFLQAAA